MITFEISKSTRLYLLQVSFGTVVYLLFLNFVLTLAGTLPRSNSMTSMAILIVEATWVFTRLSMDSLGKITRQSRCLQVKKIFQIFGK